MGIVGKDVLIEQRKDIYEPLDLKFGACRLVVVRLEAQRRSMDAMHWSHVKVATKSPPLMESHFVRKGMQTETIYLGGAIELVPLVGLSNLIVALVQTGRALCENGSVEVEEIVRSRARLVANRASLKTKCEPMQHLIKQIRSYLTS